MSGTTTLASRCSSRSQLAAGVMFAGLFQSISSEITAIGTLGEVDTRRAGDDEQTSDLRCVYIHTTQPRLINQKLYYDIRYEYRSDCHSKEISHLGRLADEHAMTRTSRRAAHRRGRLYTAPVIVSVCVRPKP